MATAVCFPLAGASVIIFYPLVLVGGQFSARAEAKWIPGSSFHLMAHGIGHRRGSPKENGRASVPDQLVNAISRYLNSPSVGKQFANMLILRLNPWAIILIPKHSRVSPILGLRRCNGFPCLKRHWSNAMLTRVSMVFQIIRYNINMV